MVFNTNRKSTNALIWSKGFDISKSSSFDFLAVGWLAG